MTASKAGAASVDRATRPAIVGDSFRAAAGLLLVAYYAEQVLLAPLTAAVWGPTGQVARTMPFPSALLLELGASGLRAWFAVAASVAALLAIGVAPRVCAALLVGIGAIDFYRLWPAVTPDDYAAEFLPFWLALLPAGGTMALPQVRRWRSWSSLRVADRSATACAVFFMLVLLNMVFRCEPMPPVASLGIFGAAALAIMPALLLRRIAIVPLAASLWSLRHLEGAWVMLGAAAACGLWVGASNVATEGEPQRGRPATFGVADAIGATVVLLIALQTGAAATGMPTIARAAGVVLASAGLPWSWTATLAPEPIGRLELSLAGKDGREEAPAEDLDTGKLRVERVLGVLRSSRSEGAEGRAAILRKVVTKRCGDRAAPWLSEGIVILRERDAARILARFECGLDEGDVRITPVNGASAAEDPQHR
ncbi:MAG TPA: hypothetical protein VLA79_07360 [Polyangia bacterium]|nr:hypothetical protein [Polyangia bacterium]